jgi:hypothetical protein
MRPEVDQLPRVIDHIGPALQMLKPSAGMAALDAPMPATNDSSSLPAPYTAQQPSLSVVKASLQPRMLR